MKQNNDWLNQFNTIVIPRHRPASTTNFRYTSLPFHMKQVIRFLLICSSFVLISCDRETITQSAVIITPSITQRPVIGVTLETITPQRVTEIPVLTQAIEEQQVTSTPTPSLYSVQAGDTMFDIAGKYQITVEQLAGLNPDIDPNLLTIGQQLIVPANVSDQNQEFIKPLSTPQLEISGLRQYSQEGGRLWILGEVVNLTDNAVEYVQVEVSLIDPESDSILKELFWVEPGLLPSGQKAPFGGLLIGYSAETSVSSATIRESNWVNDFGERYLDFEVQEATVTIEDDGRFLEGIIANSGQDSASDVVIVATLYDQEQGVSGYYYVSIDEIIPPGAFHNFEITLLPPGKDTSTFSLLIQGKKTLTD